MLCRRLRALRVQRGLTQQEVADRLEISQAAYCRLEKGRTEISVVKLLYLSGLYGVQVEELLEGL